MQVETNSTKQSIHYKTINENQKTKCKKSMKFKIQNAKNIQCKYIQKVNNEPLYLAGLQFHLINRLLQLLD